MFLAVFLCAGATHALAQSETLQPGDTLQISILQDPKLDRQVVVTPGRDGLVSACGSHQGGRHHSAGAGKPDPRPAEEKLHRAVTVTVSLAAVNPTEAASTAARLHFGRGAQARPLSGQTGHHHRAGDRACRRLKSLRGHPANSGPPEDRGADTVMMFDYKAFQSGAEPADNFALQSGDVIIVPERGCLNEIDGRWQAFRIGPRRL